MLSTQQKLAQIGEELDRMKIKLPHNVGAHSWREGLTQDGSELSRDALHQYSGLLVGRNNRACRLMMDAWELLPEE